MDEASKENNFSPDESSNTDNLDESRFKFERRTALFVAVAIVVVVLVLVLKDHRFADQDVAVLMRIVLAMAVGTLGATLPGFLSVEYNASGFAIRAAGALALFVITFFGTPYVHDKLDPKEVENQSKYLDLRASVGDQVTDFQNCSAAHKNAYRLVELRPDSKFAHNLKGIAHYCLGEIYSALEEYRIALRIDPEFDEARYNEAAALIRLGFYVAANNLLNSFVEKYDADHSARYNLAVTQALLEEYETAATNFELVHKHSAAEDSAIGLGFVHLLTGDNQNSWQTALIYFRVAFSIKPSVGCILFGQLPYDPKLHELRPFLVLYERAKSTRGFQEVSERVSDVRNGLICKQDVNIV